MNQVKVSSIKEFLLRDSTLLCIYILLPIFASIQQYFLPNRTIADSEGLYTNYNNYVIFKNSFYHLLEGKNLYIHYLDEQWDLFKYSPSFALMMGVLAYLPDLLGLMIWNLINALVPYFAVHRLPSLNHSIKNQMKWFIAVELLTSLQNAQSNGLILGCIIWCFIYLEERKYFKAALLIVTCTYVKIFGIVAVLLFILYPNKLKSAGYLSVSMIFCLLMPLVAISAEELGHQYRNWYIMLQNDHSNSVGLSVMGWIQTWFNLNPSKLIVLVIGAIGLILPLARTKEYQNFSFRILLLSSILIWLVIYNHKAESPTFIIAIGGVALWYFTQTRTPINTLLVIGAFVFSCLQSTDLFPAFIRNNLVKPYVLKAVFPIFIWIKIVIDMICNINIKKENSQNI